MIAFTRTASIAAGKIDSTVAFAKEVCAYFQKNYDVTLEVLMPIGGNPNRIRWASRYDNLAAWENQVNKMRADPVFQAMVTKASENFIAGSLEDSLWRTL